jgi:hypothetical protein
MRLSGAWRKTGGAYDCAADCALVESVSALLVGAVALAAMAIAVRVPTLKHAHIGIVTLRAALLMAREMWDAAMSRRDRWQECMERAARDV